MFRSVLTATAALLGLASCASLMPSSQSASQAAWQNFDEARTAIERVIPRQTRRDALPTLGFDPKVNHNVAMLNYAELLRRFEPGGSMAAVTLDKGVRNCLSAPSDCSGIEVNVSGEQRERVGNFWLDLFNFRRESHVTGWRFSAIILLRGDTVVFRTWGGEPSIDRVETASNPLGPLQGIGEHALH